MAVLSPNPNPRTLAGPDHGWSLPRCFLFTLPTPPCASATACLSPTPGFALPTAFINGQPNAAPILAALGDAFEGVDEHYRALVVLKRLLSATAPGDACRALHVRIAWCVRAVANTRAHVRRSC